MFLVALLGVTFNCNGLAFASVSDIAWLEPVCTQLNKDYQNVRLTPIKISRTEKAENRDGPMPIISPLKAGKLKVTVDEWTDGGTISLTFLLSVDAYQEVWVLKRDKRSGSVLGKRDVVKKVVNVAPFVNISRFVTENPSGKRVKVGLKKSTILFSDDVGSPNFIDIGDKLIARIVNGNMSIETYAIALEKSNKIGQEILIRLLSTGATFKATVKGKKDVQIDI